MGSASSKSAFPWVKIILTLGGALSLLGLFIVLGWHTHQTEWVQWGRDLPPASYGAGLAFFLAGMGILGLFSSNSSISLFFAGLTLIVSLLTHSNHWLKLLSFFEIAAVQLPFGTQVCLFVGGAVILAGWRGMERLAVMQGLGGLLIAAAGFVAGLGYLTGMRGAYQWGTGVGISPQEAVGLVLFGLTLACYGWERERQLGRRQLFQLPWQVGLSVLAATALLWNGLRIREQDKFEAWVVGKTDAIRSELVTRLDAYTKAMAHLTRRWEWEGVPRGVEWDRQLKLYSESYHFLSLRKEAKFSLITEEAKKERQPTVVSLATAESANYEIWVPLFDRGRADGYLVAQFAMASLMNHLLQDGLGDGFHWTLYEGRTPIFARKDNLQKTVSTGRTLTVLMARQVLYLNLRPTEQLWLNERSFLPETIFALGGMLALWLSVVISLAQAARKKAGETERVNGILRREIAERERIQKELEQASRAALQAAKAKSDFLANMSHEIRTPLNAVIGMSDLLGETRLNREQKESASIIQYSAKALLTLINDILDFSKIEAGKIELESTDFSLPELLQGVQKMLAPEARRKRLHFGLRLNSKLPDRLVGDPNRIRQVLLNLVNNAIKFTEKGRVTVLVTSKTTPTDRVQIRFEVIDTGIGITRAAQPNLFSAFSQADSSTTRKFGGTGLGLSISRRLVELMGGKIAFASHPGKGSRFWFTVDLGQTSAQENPKRKAKEATSTLKRLKNGILLVEDNLINQKVMQRTLGKLDLKVKIVSGGKEALAMLKQKKFDLVLMDCQMPGMDGFEATRRWREMETGHLPIIALTAHASVEDRQACEEAGMDDFLTKPVERQRLVEVLAKWLDGGTAIVDKEALAKLSELSEPGEAKQFLGEMIELFHQQGEKTIVLIRDAVKANQAETVWQTAHALKSAAGNLGAVRVASISHEIEKLGRAGRLSGVKNLLDRLELALHEAEQGLEKEAA